VGPKSRLDIMEQKTCLALLGMEPCLIGGPARRLDCTDWAIVADIPT
jgi:hypothetical protein